MSTLGVIAASFTEGWTFKEWVAVLIIAGLFVVWLWDAVVQVFELIAGLIGLVLLAISWVWERVTGQVHEEPAVAESPDHVEPVAQPAKETKSSGYYASKDSARQ